MGERQEKVGVNRRERVRELHRLLKGKRVNRKWRESGSRTACKVS